jgi:hypothetical protein
VTDKDAAVMTRRIPREEGIFAGNSAGSAMAGLMQMKDRFKEGDVVVVIFHDHGTRYLGKMFNDDWMRDRGFLEEKSPKAIDLIERHKHSEFGNNRRCRACSGSLQPHAQIRHLSNSGGARYLKSLARSATAICMRTCAKTQNFVMCQLNN